MNYLCSSLNHKQTNKTTDTCNGGSLFFVSEGRRG